MCVRCVISTVVLKTYLLSPIKIALAAEKRHVRVEILIEARIYLIVWLHEVTHAHLLLLTNKCAQCFKPLD